MKKTVHASYEEKASDSDVKGVYQRLENLKDPISQLLSTIDAETDGKFILDVGTGWGVLVIAAAKKFENAFLIGLDFSSACLKLARDAIKELGLIHRVDLVRGDAEAIPLRNATADIIVSQATLNLVPNKSKAFSELARVAKNNATISISDAIRKKRVAEGSPDLWCQCVTGAITPIELEQIMTSYGLKIQEKRDLTALVRDLVKKEKWDWPEFLRHDLAYFVMKTRKSKNILFRHSTCLPLPV